MPNSKNQTDAGAMQREIQQRQDQSDQRATQEPRASQLGERQGPVQTTQHDYPGTPLPAQHLEKPGIEARMQLKPEFLAPDYCGSGKLAGMAAIITGGDSGIGRAVAVLYAREGADVAIIYLNEDEDANDTKRFVEAEGQSCLLLRGDVRDAAFCRDAAQQVHERYGRLDILVNNAAFQSTRKSSPT